MTLTQDILERDNWVCQYCGGRAVQRDHLFSKARQPAGIDREDPEFQVASCRACNESKLAYCFVPPSMEHIIPDLNELTPGHTWRVYSGGPVSKVFTEVKA